MHVTVENSTKKELDDSKVKSDEAESYNILPLDDD